ncbi:MAG: YbaB/EbfC family nucleoid-associated protein [Rickettsiales bacterium TMED289]|nr:MAG: YbaB/EbfC family nucleoid-associated protein [Rickettsiales bacterium TMED289]|tara:strand:+ start:476 stop:793 length:318 start_codon:yes stop_codon:yes gene_type:complete
MTDFTKIINKAKELETNMKERQNNIRKIEVEGVAGGDKVRIKINGENEIINIYISDSLMKEDKTIIEDLVKAAHNNARMSLKQKTSDEMSKIAEDFSIPGFKWPT